jgi:hypothetical protein
MKRRREHIIRQNLMKLVSKWELGTDQLSIAFNDSSDIGGVN